MSKSQILSNHRIVQLLKIILFHIIQKKRRIFFIFTTLNEISKWSQSLREIHPKTETRSSRPPSFPLPGRGATEARKEWTERPIPIFVRLRPVSRQPHLRISLQFLEYQSLELFYRQNSVYFAKTRFLEIVPRLSSKIRSSQLLVLLLRF